MHPARARWVVVAALVVATSAAPVHARLYQDVMRGYELFGWQFTGQPNLLGDGWDVYAFANYQAGRQYNLGVGSLSLSDAAITASVGWTLRGVPTGRFSLTTNGDPLSYSYTLNTGWQNASLSGNVLFNIDTEVNLIGFYDQTIQVSNRASVASDGLLGEHDRTLDYDIGPIDISGNVYLDALAVVTQPFYNATGAENPFAKLSPRTMRAASMAETVADLRARAAAGDLLTDEEMATLISDSILLDMLNPASSMGEGFVADKDLLDSDGSESGSPELEAYLVRSGRVPEPTTLLLLALGTIALCRWRKAA